MLINNITEVIGNTPLLCLKKMSTGNVYAKAEFLNPGGSIKDRVAKYIIEEAEREQKLRPGMTIIEATSGNTGIGLAFVGVNKGYEVICVMPENMSAERKKIMHVFGSKIITTAAEESLTGSISRLREIIKEEPERYFVVDQFVNPKNPETHYKILGHEI